LVPVVALRAPNVAGVAHLSVPHVRGAQRGQGAHSHAVVLIAGGLDLRGGFVQVPEVPLSVPGGAPELGLLGRHKQWEIIRAGFFF
jgi:hypothetical protein